MRIGEQDAGQGDVLGLRAPELVGAEVGVDKPSYLFRCTLTSFTAIAVGIACDL